MKKIHGAMAVDLSDLIGVPYLLNGRDKNGMDCYGLVLEVQRRLGKKLNDLVYDTSADVDLCNVDTLSFLGIRKTDSPQFGDVMAVKKDNELHVAVYLNEKEMLHASPYGVKVSCIDLYGKERGFYTWA